MRSAPNSIEMTEAEKDDIRAFVTRRVVDVIAISLFVAAVVVGLLFGFLVGKASAAEPLGKGKIAAPPAQQAYTPFVDRIGAPGEPAWKAHNWYVGGVAGYAWAPSESDDAAQGGIIAGYLWRNATLGLGVEADYVVRDLGDFAIDDGVASVRGRAGMFVGQGTFLYGTAGVARTYSNEVPGDLRQGLVVGGGVEKDIAVNLALRAELLHYRQGDELFGWGEDGSTAVRGGLLYKF